MSQTPPKRVIAFDPRQRALAAARGYLADPERFLADLDRAIPLLLRAYQAADDPRKRDIIGLLGGVSRPEVARALYEILGDSAESEEVRLAAAIQLCVTLPLLADPAGLIERLLADLRCDSAARRRLAALALGWEGNQPAALALVELLFDPDAEVQQAAVHALANLEDDRALKLLEDRLTHGPPAQQKTILFNLWRFEARRGQVAAIYRRFLDHSEAELRHDALELLAAVAEPELLQDARCHALGDASARVRLLALTGLAQTPGRLPPEAIARLKDLQRDPHPAVRAAALALERRSRGAPRT
ncbi:MAG: HEAT repeat domain-containing protein [Desulfobacteraceae bacterium]|jgi:HEAT repeat protein